MKDKVLFVDDEATQLKIYVKALQDLFDVTTAGSGEDALELVASAGPFAVVVSDMQMPGMDGIELLERLKQAAPDTVRMMLTGVSDQMVAMNAVNKGEIFRFLAKPPKRQILIEAVTAAIQQHQLICAEQVLLESTLKGSVEALAHVLALSDPRIFGRTTRLKELALAVAEALALDDKWELETAVMLCQLGCITLQDDLIDKVSGHKALSAAESVAYARYPAASAELIGKIPRMESVANMVRYQLKGFDGSGTPNDAVKGRAIPLGARILKVVHDFERFEARVKSADKALSLLLAKASVYDPDIIAALSAAIIGQGSESVTVETKEIRVSQLKTDMVIAEDVRHKTGSILVCSGQRVSNTLRERLANFAGSGAIAASILVQISAPGDGV